MENALPDDVFTSRNVVNRRPSSSRIHFPSNNHSLARQGRLRSEVPRTPSVRRGSPLNPHKVHQAMDLGRRQRSSQADMAAASTDSSLRQRRNPSISLVDTTRDSDISTDEALEVGVFSNEYDLSHEDPRILQDVQRALKMKARREARLKQKVIADPNFTEPKQTSALAQPQTPPSKPLLSGLKLHSSSSFSSPSSRKLSFSSPTSDIDFSPSTAIPELFVQPSHPIPSSLDNGITLDWTGRLADDADRRWIISIGKKKEKDKLPPLAATVDQQDQSHKEKLSRIHSLASSQTTRKATITSEQLGRRYRLIYESLASKQVPLNPVQIARWLGTKDEPVRKSLEKAEPFTWLKHLNKSTSKSSRSPWYLSALIMEEYVHAQSFRDRMRTVSEDPAVLESESHFPRPQSFLSPSRLGLANVPGSFKSTKLTTAGISFEPKATRTTSTDTASRKSADSASSSGATGSSIFGAVPLSPVSSRLNDFVEKAVDSDRHETPDDTSSSDGSEVSDNDQPQLLISVPDVLLQPPSSENVAVGHPAIPLPLALPSSTGNLESTNPPPGPVSPENQSLSSLKSSSNHRRIRTSLHTSRPGRRDSRRENSEESLRLEYEAKAALLQESITHNHRIRQLLNRVSAAVKEYDTIQSVAFQTLDIDPPSMPRDFLEAFAHDPSAVTGSTRRLRGWRAVEDINQRLTRQRNVLKRFHCPLAENVSARSCLLDESIEILLQTLKYLEDRKDAIALRAVSILNLLNSVQELHANVKENYKVTVSRASVVYPELSHIVALEESYKDQYQHFWELGMDALTLLLDTVTPFWRTYGKTIGEDVQDFLIIPLYRNEFTGETKRYPINEMPRRSFHHWLGLVAFFFLSIGIIILQVRAAISSSLHFRLRLIPYDGIRWTALPFFWIAILIQWVAVVFELAIVFMQAAVITWWTGWSVKILS